MSAPSKFKTKAQRAETVEAKAMVASPAPDPKKLGKVYTFYSFKGGVGRSMAMANIATLIASEGRKVLVVDWDLEAPGLEHYFFKHDTGLADRMKDSLGVVDLLTPNEKGDIADWRQCITQIKMHDVQLDFMQSGKRTRSAELYTQQVQGLDWQALYDQHDIGARFDQIRQEWLLEYDFVFLDSRTGVTDIGDLCTVVLPDHLVLLFVTNTQNVQGIKDIYTRVQAAHDQLPADRMQLTALPLLSRDEFYSEHAQSSQWRRQAAGELAEIYEAWLPANVRPHEAIQKLFVPYYAIWSFGEALPVMDDPDAIDNPASINAAFSRVSHLILNDLNWSSLNLLNTPDAGGQAIKAQAALEERQAELEAEFKARAQKTRQATGVGMLAIIALIAGIGYWLYTSAVDQAAQDAIAAERQAILAQEQANAAKLEAERQIQQMAKTQEQLKTLQTTLDVQLNEAERERLKLTEQIKEERQKQDSLQREIEALQGDSKSLASIQTALRNSEAEQAKQERTIQSLLAEIDGLATENKSLSAAGSRLSDAQAQIADLKLQIARLDEAGKTALAQCQVNFRDAKTEVQALRERGIQTTQDLRENVSFLKKQLYEAEIRAKESSRSLRSCLQSLNGKTPQRKK